MTEFNTVYKRFLSKVTDDMYMEITIEETERLLQDLLESALPWFEFPRQSLAIENGSFISTLEDEEINIIATYMIVEWLGQQLATVELTRMKYSGSDFKFTSQANHLSKLLSLLEETQRQSHHMQRLYKRRKTDDKGNISSNWSVLRKVSALDD